MEYDKKVRIVVDVTRTYENAVSLQFVSMQPEGEAATPLRPELHVEIADEGGESYYEVKRGDSDIVEGAKIEGVLWAMQDIFNILIAE